MKRKIYTNKKNRVFGGTVALMFLLVAVVMVSPAMKDSHATEPEKAVSLTKTVSAVKAETTDQQDVIKFSSSAGEVDFPHKMHAIELEIDCKECHHETNAPVLDLPHPSYFADFWINCSICHHSSENEHASVQPCSNCHHSSPVTIADETLSSKVVIHKTCWGCHEISTGAEASESCKSCHSGPKSKR